MSGMRTRRPLRPLPVLASAPSATVLASASLAIILAVTNDLVRDHRLSATASFGLICAVVLGVAAFSELSRAARRERARRRLARR